MRTGSAVATQSSSEKPSNSGNQTKQRILDATVRTLKEEGIAGTSARAIARAGDFNQALIFYHFDSVNGALIAAVADLTRQRKERHGERLGAASTLNDLVDIALELHTEDVEMHHMAALTQAIAGASGDPEMGPALFAQLDHWSETVAGAIERVLGDSPLAELVPHDDIARMIGSLFLGIELLNDLAPEQAESERLFETLRSLAAILQMLIDSPLAGVVPELLENAQKHAP